MQNGCLDDLVVSNNLAYPVHVSNVGAGTAGLLPSESAVIYIFAPRVIRTGICTAGRAFEVDRSINQAST